MLTEMDVMDSFSADLRIPSLTHLSQLSYVLREIQLFSDAEEERRAMNLLEQAGFSDRSGAAGKLNIGIKKLLSMAEMCRQDSEGAGEALVGKLIEFAM